MNKKICSNPKTKAKRISLEENALLIFINKYKSEIIEGFKLGFECSDKEEYAIMFFNLLMNTDSKNSIKNLKCNRAKSDKYERYTFVKKVEKNEELIINFSRIYRNEIIEDLQKMCNCMFLSISKDGLICDSENTYKTGRLIRTLSGMINRIKFTLDGLVSMDVCTESQKEMILKYVKENRNILITGYPGVGKTTLLNALLNYINISNLKIIDTLSEFYLQKNNLNKEITIIKEIGDLTVKDLTELSYRKNKSTVVVSDILFSEIQLKELEFLLKNMSRNTNILATCQCMYSDCMSDELKKHINERNIVEIHFQEPKGSVKRKIEYIRDLDIL